MTNVDRNLGVSEPWGRAQEAEIEALKKRLRALEGAQKNTNKNQTILSDLQANTSVEAQRLRAQLEFQDTVTYSNEPPTLGVDEADIPGTDDDLDPITGDELDEDPELDEDEVPDEDDSGDPWEEDDGTPPEPAQRWVQEDPDTGEILGEWVLEDGVWTPRQVGSGYIADGAVLQGKLADASVELRNLTGDLSEFLDDLDEDLGAAQGRLDTAEQDIQNAFLDARGALEQAIAARDRAESENLYPDPSFEGGGVGLDLLRTAIVDEPEAKHGGKVLQFTGSNGYAYAPYVPAVEGDIFHASMWLRRTDESQSGIVGLRFSTHRNGESTDSGYVSSVNVGTLPVGEWTLLDGDYTAPANSFKLRISPLSSPGDSAGVQVDLVRVVNVTELRRLEQVADQAKGESAQAVERANQSVKGSVIQYAVNSSRSTAPSSGWSTTQPSPSAGQYVWMRTQVTYGDDTSAYTAAALITGNDGAKGETGAKGSTGAKGADGAKGDQGISITSVTPYFRAATSKPAQPSGASPAGWSTTEPVPGASDYMWRAERVALSNSTYQWTPVTRVESFEVAREAKDIADSAMLMAGSKTAVYYSTSDPSGTSDREGDTWRKRDSNNNIIAEWRWSGSAWVSQEISSAVISNLDVGKLTAGAASISEIVAQKIAAASGQFLELDVEQLNVTGGSNLKQAVADVIWAKKIGAQKVLASEMLVGGRVNLATIDPFTGEVVTDEGRFTNAVDGDWIKHTGSTKEMMFADLQFGFPFEPGEPLLFEFTAKTTSGTVNAPGYVWTYNSASTWQHQTAGTTFSITSTEKRFSGVVNAPTQAQPLGGGFRIGLNPSSLSDANKIRIRDVTVRRMVDHNLIVDGGVLARHLDVVAETGKRRLTITPTGIRLWGNVEAGGDPNISITTDGVEYFSIASDEGDTLSSLDDEGNVTGQTVSANEDVVVGGESLLEWMDAQPRGIIATGTQDIRGRTVTADSSTRGRLAFMEMEADFEEGRAYSFQMDQISVEMPADTRVSSAVWYTTDGTQPNFSSPVLLRFEYTREGSAGIASVGGTQLFFPPSDQTMRLMFGLEFRTSSASVKTLTIVSTYISTSLARVAIVDQGLLTVEDTGVNRTLKEGPSGSSAGSGDATPKKTYKKTYTATGGTTYRNDGSRVHSGSMWYNRVAQGTPPGSAESNLRGVWLFDSMASDLSGSTITKIRVYVTNQHTNFSAGSTANFFSHTRTNLSSSQSASSTNGFTSKFNKGQGKWVTVPAGVRTAIGNGLKSGSIRGFGLSVSGSGNYGYWSSSAKIEVTYVK